MSATESPLSHGTAFEVNLLPVRAVFGDGQRSTLPERLAELSIARPLLVGTAAAATRHRDVVAPLDGAALATFFAAEPHCPEAVVERCSTCTASERKNAWPVALIAVLNNAPAACRLTT